MTDRPPPPERDPGTLTSLLDEVFRGSGADQAAWADGLGPGTTLGRYDLIREVGRGGSGIIWEARDRELGRRVAVKVIRRPPGSMPERRLLAEAEVAARLSHPGIVTVLDVGRSDRGAWLVEEFLVGRTLAARLKDGALPVPEALEVATRIAAALSYAHAHGVVHRDLTAANVFLCEDGQVKLLDLGISQAFGRPRVGGGTKDFMAPEQEQGLPEDERVDVYALGILLGRMLAGPTATTPEPTQAQPARIETPGLPALGELVERMTAADPRDRPRNASEVQAALETLRTGVTSPTTGTGTGSVTVRVRKRTRPGLVAAGVIVALAAAGLVGASLGRRAASSTPAPIVPVPFGAKPTSNVCTWGNATWTDLDRLPAGAVLRNGDVGGQGVAEVGGRRAWRITSDWGVIVLPLGVAAQGDPFAVEVEFFIPPVTGWMRGADIRVFADLVGDSGGATVHGFSFGVREEPGKPPYFEWHEPVGTQAMRRYVGNLSGPVSGRWRSLRVEGSRSGKWFRGLLDGEPLVMAYGDYDLAGSHVVVGSGYGYMNPEDVAFSNLRTFAGTPECR